MPTDDGRPSRRALLVALVPTGLAAAGMVGGAGAMLAPPRPRRPDRVRRVCAVAEMDVGGQATLDAGVLVVRDHAGIHAIGLACTHLGCAVTRSQGGFRCHCHGSAFDEEGRPTAGPATRDLPWYAVVVRDGWVLVDLDRTVPTGTVTGV